MKKFGSHEFIKMCNLPPGDTNSKKLKQPSFETTFKIRVGQDNYEKLLRHSG